MNKKELENKVMEKLKEIKKLCDEYDPTMETMSLWFSRRDGEVIYSFFSLSAEIDNILVTQEEAKR